jgi:apolipoprotein N-acyltransferase
LSDALAGTFLRSWSIMTHVPGTTRRHLELTAALVVLLVAFSFGLGRIRSIRAAEESATARHLRVAAVDPSQPCIFADNGDEWDAAVERMFSLCFMAAAARPDFIALPETSLWETMPSPRLERSLADFSSQLGAPILAGGTLVQDGRPNAAVQPVKNAYWMFSPDGISKPYVKRHLVPFGEFIPLDETFPILQKLSPVGVTCTPGAAPVHFRCNGFNISPLICFEDTDSPTVRSAAKGADLLLSASNDAWFDGSCEAEQHHREASIRAVETGVPLLRVSNRGIGGVFSPTGAKTPDGGAVFVHPVPIPDARLMPPNVYMRFGDWMFGYPCAAALALTVLFRRGFGKRRFWREKRL